jgi:hypothetical protein
MAEGPGPEIDPGVQAGAPNANPDPDMELSRDVEPSEQSIPDLIPTQYLDPSQMQFARPHPDEYTQRPQPPQQPPMQMPNDLPPLDPNELQWAAPRPGEPLSPEWEKFLRSKGWPGFTLDPKDLQFARDPWWKGFGEVPGALLGGARDAAADIESRAGKFLTGVTDPLAEQGLPRWAVPALPAQDIIEAGKAVAHDPLSFTPVDPLGPLARQTATKMAQVFNTDPKAPDYLTQLGQGIKGMWSDVEADPWRATGRLAAGMADPAWWFAPEAKLPEAAARTLGKVGTAVAEKAATAGEFAALGGGEAAAQAAGEEKPLTLSDLSMAAGGAALGSLGIGAVKGAVRGERPPPLTPEETGRVMGQVFPPDGAPRGATPEMVVTPTAEGYATHAKDQPPGTGIVKSTRAEAEEARQYLQRIASFYNTFPMSPETSGPYARMTNFWMDNAYTLENIRRNNWIRYYDPSLREPTGKVMGRAAARALVAGGTAYLFGGLPSALVFGGLAAGPGLAAHWRPDMRINMAGVINTYNGRQAVWTRNLTNFSNWIRETVRDPERRSAIFMARENHPGIELNSIEQGVLDQVGAFFDMMGETALDADVIRGILDDYVTHIVENAPEMAKGRSEFERIKDALWDIISFRAGEEDRRERGAGVSGTRFGKRRTYPTIMELQEALRGSNLRIKTTDIAEVIDIYGQSMFRAIERKRMIEALKNWPVQGFPPTVLGPENRGMPPEPRGPAGGGLLEDQPYTAEYEEITRPKRLTSDRFTPIASEEPPGPPWGHTRLYALHSNALNWTTDINRLHQLPEVMRGQRVFFMDVPQDQLTRYRKTDTSDIYGDVYEIPGGQPKPGRVQGFRPHQAEPPLADGHTRLYAMEPGARIADREERLTAAANKDPQDLLRDDQLLRDLDQDSTPKRLATDFWNSVYPKLPRDVQHLVEDEIYASDHRPQPGQSWADLGRWLGGDLPRTFAELQGHELGPLVARMLYLMTVHEAPEPTRWFTHNRQMAEMASRDVHHADHLEYVDVPDARAAQHQDPNSTTGYHLPRDVWSGSKRIGLPPSKPPIERPPGGGGGDFPPVDREAANEPGGWYLPPEPPPGAAARKFAAKEPRHLIEPAKDAGPNYETMPGRFLEGYKVHKDIAPQLRFVYDAYTPHDLLIAANRINMTQKRMIVAMSLFHAQNLYQAFLAARRGLGIEAIPLVGAPATYAAAKRMMERYRLPANDPDIEALLMGGLRIGRPLELESDQFNRALAWVQQNVDTTFPITAATEKARDAIGKFDRALNGFTFDTLQNGFKLIVALDSLEQLTGKGIPRARAAEIAANYANTIFGSLDWFRMSQETGSRFARDAAYMFFTPTGKRAMQLLMFAPDWTFATFRSAYMALPGAVEDSSLAALHRRYLMKTALYYLTLANGLNYLMAGKYIWQNSDPTRIEKADGRTMQFSKHAMEPFEFMQDPIQTADNKLGFWPRVAGEMAFGKQWIAHQPHYAPDIVPTGAEGLDVPTAYANFLAKQFLPISSQQWLAGGGVSANISGLFGVQTYGATEEKKQEYKLESRKERFERKKQRMEKGK